MKKNFKRWSFLLCAVLIAVTLVAVGCGTDKKPVDEGNNQPADQQEVELTLYFSDDQAMYLVPEKRAVPVEKKDAETIGRAAVEALIAGPKEDGLVRTIPDGTKLLSIEVKDGTAVVDFNKAFKENHWGGTAGESHTMYSVINTLAKNIDVKDVKFTIEGEVQETILGHMATAEPLEPNFEIVKE